MQEINKAQILSDALPYIQKYFGKVVVVKYGGNAMINEELKEAVMRDIILLTLVGIKVVLVHGGGPEINEMLGKIGKQGRFVDGLRYTDEETMDIVQMVLCGKVNKNLVSLIHSYGGRALGFCGLDGNLLTAEKLEKDGKEWGFVGEITDVNPQPIFDALEKGYIPVVATVAHGTDGHSYNINADTAAAKIAAALGAANLMLLTDVKGLLRDVKDESTLIPKVNVSAVPKLVKEGIIQGGMIPKIDCCVEAVRRGVTQANIIDGRVPHSVLLEILTHEGAGTMIY
ncbi:MAG: acetylglutamate kinase [Eubacteriales bacterium]|jgi:acetylglutamate kinase